MPDGTVKCIENEIPFEVPAGWAWTRVGTISNGLPYGTAKKSSSCGCMAVLRMGNIQFGEINYDDLVYSSDKEDLEKYSLANGDLLFNRTNSAEWVGKTAIYHGNIPAIFAGYLIRLRTFINSEYLNAVMNSSYEKEYCNSVKTDAVNQSNINAQKLGNFLIPAPPLVEQTIIARSLMKLLLIVSNLHSDVMNIKMHITQAKSKILDLAIRGKLVPQDPSDEPASVLLERIRAEKEELVKQGKIKREKSESFIFRGDDKSYYQTLEQNSIKIDEPFLLPPNWIWVSHNELFNVSGGAQPPKDTFVFAPRSNYIRLFQIRDYGKKPEPVYIHESKATKRTVEGDIILARYGASLGKVFIAKEGAYNVAMAKVEKQFCVDVNNMFIYYYYLSSLYQGILSSFSRTAQAGFNKGDLRDLLFPLPPINEQHRIATAIETAFEQLDTIMNTLA